MPVKKIAALLLVVGCSGARTVQPPLSSGTAALSSDDALLYAVDTDNGIVGVVDTATLTKVAEVKVGAAPSRIAVAPDDTLYVANQSDRSVSVIRRGTWAEAARIPVGVEPSGLAVSPDSKTLYVVNATSRTDPTVGTLMAIDTGSLSPRWEIPVGQEPRAIALRDSRTAAVSLVKQGDVVLVDVEKAALISQGTDLYAQANRQDPNAAVTVGVAPVPGLPFVPQTFHPRTMSDLTFNPRDGRLHATVTWSSEAVIPETDPDAGSSGGGGSAYGSSCGGSVAFSGIATLASDGVHAALDSLAQCGNGQVHAPTPVLASSGVVLQGPSAIVADPTGAWLFITHRSSNNVAVVPAVAATGGSGIGSVVSVGQGPSGIALQRNGTRAFVYNSFSHSVTVLTPDGSGQIQASQEIPIAADVLPADVVAGRSLFFSAVDTRMSSTDTGIACATCHVQGREDGHVWLFAEGPRRTPSLAGRMITATAPFHWSGQFATLNDFLTDTITLRMGGTGATADMSRQLSAYIDSLAEPDNAAQLATPSAGQLRGVQVFQSAGCAACHSGPALTNDGFANVGTLVTDGAVPDDLTRIPNGLNVPSLLGLARTAPFLHDGSAATLLDRLRKNQGEDLHGRTSTLTAQQLDDLVDYLQSL
jgi:YVTN family beta-propeller protein